MFKQSAEEEIVKLNNENYKLQTKIITLTGKDRIYENAKDNGMNVNPENIYAVASMNKAMSGN